MLVKPLSFTAVSFLVLACAFASYASATLVTFNVIDDATLIADSPDNDDRNYGGRSNVIIGSLDSGGGRQRNALLRWDLSSLDGLIESVNSVQLTLSFSGASNTPGVSTDFEISRVSAANANWVEGSLNGQAGSDHSGLATWSERAESTPSSGGNVWDGGAGAAGNTQGVFGSFNISTAAAIAGTPLSISLVDAPGFDSLTELIQDWAAAGANSEGFVIDRTGGSANIQYFFDSLETNSGSPASLTIDYVAAIPEASQVLALGLLVSIGLVLAGHRKMRATKHDRGGSL